MSLFQSKVISLVWWRPHWKQGRSTLGEFSAKWLELREPVDHAARSQAVLQTLVRDMSQHHGGQLNGLQVLDLGCGSGSNLRALAPHLGDDQHWVLVDYDDALLAAAREALQTWAHGVLQDGTDGIVLSHSGLTISVRFWRADLSTDLPALLGQPTDLVTASALFDLVSAAWVDRFVAQLAAPLYAVLSFDGQMLWWPEHPSDELVTTAFSRHQQQDKGFGNALGPHSGHYLAEALDAQGFQVVTDKSPWHIETLPSAFHDMLIEGIATAAGDMQAASPEALAHWLETRRVAQRCIIGHDDLYAARR